MAVEKSEACGILAVIANGMLVIGRWRSNNNNKVGDQC